MSTSFTVSTKLPKMKLSELLVVAIDDLCKCKDAGMDIDMQFWHAAPMGGYNDGACMVCLAGGVMAQELHVPNDHGTPEEDRVWHEVTPEDIEDRRTRQYMYALNEVRSGHVERAVQYMQLGDEWAGDPPPAISYCDMPIELRSVGVTPYRGVRGEGDPDARFGMFVSEMRDLACRLAAAGF